MLIDSMNLYHLRVFECVYRTLSMTKAAGQLHMTQSGVSQHIKHLEDLLQVKLFDRVKQKLVPTDKGHLLFEESSKGLDILEKALSEVKSDSKDLYGKVRIGLPVEFGNNRVLPLLAEIGKEHPRLVFEITYELAPKLHELLLKGHIDFAFCDNYPHDSLIATEVVYKEELILCASKKYLDSFIELSETRELFEKFDYIDYVEKYPVLEIWFKHHFHFKNFKPNIRASLLDVQGVFRLIREDFGVGVVPLHMLESIPHWKDSLYAFKGNIHGPCLNEISLAYLKERTLGKQAQYCLEKLKF